MQSQLKKAGIPGEPSDQIDKTTKDLFVSNLPLKNAQVMTIEGDKLVKLDHNKNAQENKTIPTGDFPFDHYIVSVEVDLKSKGDIRNNKKGEENNNNNSEGSNNQINMKSIGSQGLKDKFYRNFSDYEEFKTSKTEVDDYNSFPANMGDKKPIDNEAIPSDVKRRKIQARMTAQQEYIKLSKKIENKHREKSNKPKKWNVKGINSDFTSVGGGRRSRRRSSKRRTRRLRKVKKSRRTRSLHGGRRRKTKKN